MIRTLLLSISIFLMAASLSYAQEAACPVPEGTYVYEIKRKDKPTGIHVVYAGKSDGGCTVEAEEWYKDTAYCHHSFRTEEWFESKLQSYVSRTAGWCGLMARTFAPNSCKWRKDNRPLNVAATRESDSILIVSDDGQREARGDALTLNFLNHSLVERAGSSEVIHPTRGEVTVDTAEKQGAEEIVLTSRKGAPRAKGERWAYDDGKRKRTLWYGEDGVLLKTHILDNDVTFTLMPGLKKPPRMPKNTHKRCRASLR